MEEKKKRFRPTLASYREQEEVIHRQCQELDAWREKYRLVMKKGTVPKYRYDEMVNEVKRLCSEVVTLQQSNKSMDDELRRKANRHEAEMKRWKERALESEAEVMRLNSRGFWSRLFNL